MVTEFHQDNNLRDFNGSECNISFFRQAEHQSMVVESSGTLNHINVKILFDSGATDSSISPSTLKKSGLEAYEHDDFKQVEMASEKKKTSGRT
jgi:hypothetical protein